MPTKRPRRKTCVEKQKEFLAAYRKLRVVKHAAAQVGMQAVRHRLWMRRDPRYRQRFLRLRQELLSKTGTESGKELAMSTIVRKKQNAFLAAFLVNPRIGAAAKASGIGESRHRQWLKNDPDYVRRFEQYRLAVAELLYDSAWQMAVRGEPTIRFYHNEPLTFINPETGREEIYIERRYSDRMLMFLLKALHPEKYHD